YSLCLSSFFFSSRRRHTRFSRDWSSDVCSSDLIAELLEHTPWNENTVRILDGAGMNPTIRASEVNPLIVPLLTQVTQGEIAPARSEERRVGKECRSRWAACA